jgi:hypothetical protein
MKKTVKFILKTISIINLRINSNSVSYVIIILVLNSFIQHNNVLAGPTPQQEQDLMLLDALGRRQTYNTNNNYESNSIMEILGKSTERLNEIK